MAQAAAANLSPSLAPSTVKLTNCQQRAVDAFFDFMHADEQCFEISGTAGTGKTFLMNYLATRVMSQYRESCELFGIEPQLKGVIFTATTNKAAEVLENTLGTPVQTIHSFLGLKIKENYKTGKAELIRTDRWVKHKDLIVFIDECSMIDQRLYQEIHQALEGCRIVYVGDHAQMAPVGERLSLIYSDVAEKNRITLKEPVRNAGQPALVALCTQLRETVETGIFKPIEEVDGAIHHLSDQDMADGLHYIFKDLDPSCRVLSYTNSRVQYYNQYIREQVRGRPPEALPGDVMVLAQPYNRGAVSLSVESEVTVVDVGPVENFTAYGDIANPTPIPSRKLTVIPRLLGSEVILRVAEDPMQVQKLAKSMARKKNWREFFELKASFADLRDKAACTVYKAQGSTYDSVFVDLGNIGTSFDPEQIARMIFVAASRARKAVYFYGSLPPKYQNSRGVPLWDAKPSPSPSSTLSSNTAPVLSVSSGQS